MDKNLYGPVSEQQKPAAWIHFHGVVGDNQGSGVERAIVMVLACFNDGMEKPLAHTFTGQDGKYFITIPRPPDNSGIIKFKVRAGKPHMPGEIFDYPVTGPGEPGTGWETDIQRQVDDLIPAPDSIFQQTAGNIEEQVKSSAPTEDFIDDADCDTGLTNPKSKAGESEYYRKIAQQLSRQLPEKIFFVPPGSPPALENSPTGAITEPVKRIDPKIDPSPPKYEFPATFLYSYLTCLLLVLRAQK